MSIKEMYETTFIVTSDVSDEDYNAIVDKFTRIMTENGAELINVEKWGLKKMAYPIKDRTNGKKKQSGYYAYVEFVVTGELISKLTREYLYDERIMRYLTVKMDKHAVAYNKKRREGSFNKTEPQNVTV